MSMHSWVCTHLSTQTWVCTHLSTQTWACTHLSTQFWRVYCNGGGGVVEGWERSSQREAKCVYSRACLGQEPGRDQELLTPRV